MLAALNDRVRHETPGLAQRDQHTLVRDSLKDFVKERHLTAEEK